MAWEHRNGKGRYFARSVWRNGRVQRVYYGAGQRGELAAAQHAEERQQREAGTAARLAQQAKWDVATRPLDELGLVTDALARSTLHAAGFHQHHRGEWRRRRDSGHPQSLTVIEAVVDDSTWRLGLDLARQARRSWLELLAEQDVLLEVGAERHLAAWMKTLPRAWPGRLGQLLLHRVALTQLRLVYWHGQQARQLHGPEPRD